MAQIPTWHVAGDWFDNCSCAVACPYTFAQAPDNGYCESVLFWHIRRGHYGDIKLDGLSFVRVGRWEGDLWAGKVKGAAGLFIEPAKLVPERDDVSDDGDQRWPEGEGRLWVGEVAERASHRFLSLRCAPADQRHGGARRAATGDKRGGDPRQAPRAHEDHQGVDRRRQARPVDVRRAPRRVFVAGHDGERRGEPAVRERNAGVRGDGDGSTDAGDHLEGDRRRRESLGFLAAPSKDEGIAALEPHHTTTTTRMSDEERVDVFLGQAVTLREDIRSEEHTSELQSPCNLVCRLLLEKKKKNTSPVKSPTDRDRVGHHGERIAAST